MILASLIRTARLIAEAVGEALEMRRAYMRRFPHTDF